MIRIAIVYLQSKQLYAYLIISHKLIAINISYFIKLICQRLHFSSQTNDYILAVGLLSDLSNPMHINLAS